MFLTTIKCKKKIFHKIGNLLKHKNKKKTMQVEEDPKKVKGRGFRCFYYGVLLIYVAALSHMVVVSVAMNGTQSAFSTPLVVISLLIPFHVNIKVNLFRDICSKSIQSRNIDFLFLWIFLVLLP